MVGSSRIPLRFIQATLAGPQRVDVLRQECATTPSQSVDREEIRPAGVPGASIIGHGVAWQEYGAMRCAYCALRWLIPAEINHRTSQPTQNSDK